MAEEGEEDTWRTGRRPRCIFGSCAPWRRRWRPAKARGSEEDQEEEEEEEEEEE